MSQAKMHNLGLFTFLGIPQCKQTLASSLYLNSNCIHRTIITRYLSKIDNEDYLDCYSILQVATDCDQEDVRQAFLKLAKRFHPDSASPEADSIKFNLIEEAYRKLNNKFAQTRLRGNEDISDFNCNKNKAVKEFDIKHTAPQHRQYLSYGGYGYGSPQKREKQFMKHRADVAINNIYNHRVSKLSKYVDEVMVVKDKKESKKIKISSEIDRLVEDLIQESMAKGDFDHLSGKGKPLPYKNTNPYVDFVTQKMNEVLIENGFTPEWITLQKEIREELHILRESLFSDRTYFGTFPLFDDEIIEWTKLVARHNDLVDQINKKINKFNLLVPLLSKQMFLINLEKEADKVLKSGKTKHEVKPSKNKQIQANDSSRKSDFMSLIYTIFHQ